jgi:glycine/serine hydroxymethyltransferase
MEQIADWIKQAIDNRDNLARLEELRAAVASFVKAYPLPSDSQEICTI